jgi:hypothetical protein
MTKHTTSLSLFSLSLVALLGSFYFPFFSIQLKMEVPEAVGIGKDLIVTGMSAPFAGTYITDITNNFFGQTLFSQTCQADWSPCFQDWIADQIGITRGNQYLLNMIKDTFGHGEAFLGTIILVFSILFPLSKNLLGLAASMSGTQASKQSLYSMLTKTSKWSMTDVFVVALLILFMKADNIHLYMQADNGVYCFAVSALLSSLGAYVLGQELGAKLHFTATSTSSLNPSYDFDSGHSSNDDEF